MPKESPKDLLGDPESASSYYGDGYNSYRTEAIEALNKLKSK